MKKEEIIFPVSEISTCSPTPTPQKNPKHTRKQNPNKEIKTNAMASGPLCSCQGGLGGDKPSAIQWHLKSLNFFLAVYCSIHPLWDTQLGLQLTAVVFKHCLGFIPMSRAVLQVPLQTAYRSCHLCQNSLQS